jgi:hypothetical protein
LQHFCPHSFALFQSVSSQASMLASRFHDGCPLPGVGTSTCSSAFRFVCRLARADIDARRDEMHGDGMAEAVRRHMFGSKGWSCFGRRIHRGTERLAATAGPA